MAYRNGNERLLIRNQELEAELQQAHATIRRLKGDDEPGTRPMLERLVGGSGDVNVSVVVPGTLDDDSVAGVLAKLTRRFDASGQVSRIGKRLSWSSPRTFEQTRNVDIAFTECDAGVEVEVRERVARFGVITYALLWSLLLPFGFATAVSLGHAISLAFAAPLFLLSALVARALFRFWVARRRRLMQAVADEVAAVLREGGAGRRREPQGVAGLDEDEVARERAAEAEAEAEGLSYRARGA